MFTTSKFPAPAWLPALLAVNAISSAAIGVLLMGAGGVAADLMFARAGTLLGLDLATILRLVGAGLILFAAAVGVTARESPPPTSGLGAIFALDVGWVAGSVALLVGLPSLWTTMGVAATLAVAFAVAFFAWCEGIALNRLRRGREPAYAGAQ